jgi:hypothetical protein
MSKTYFVLVPLTMVILFGLLMGGGWAIHRIGWAEGYTAGTSVAAGEASIVPYAPIGLSRVVLFLTAGLAFLVFVAFVGKLLSLWAFKTVAGPWMMAGGPSRQPVGPNGEQWTRRWHRHPHHVPPWCWGWEQAPDETRGDQGDKPPSATTDSEAKR